MQYFEKCTKYTQCAFCQLSFASMGKKWNFWIFRILNCDYSRFNLFVIQRCDYLTANDKLKLISWSLSHYFSIMCMRVKAVNLIYSLNNKKNKTHLQETVCLFSQLQYPVYWDLMEFCDGFRKLLDYLQLDKVGVFFPIIYSHIKEI